jgi:uncharacterized protein YjiS (DUF1127 family)
MEMLSSESLYALYGIAIQSRSHTRRLGANSLLAIGRWIARAILRERAIRRATEELANLDDHLLRDIGISRQDIRDVVREGRLPRWRVDGAL